MDTPALFLTNLAKVVSTMNLYKAGHPARERAIDSAYEHLVDLQEETPRAVFTFLADEIVFGARPLRELGKWGWRLFARKGQRNIAVGAVARKLATQAWHLLSGNKPELLEPTKSRQTKLTKLTVMLGKALRTEMQLPPTISDCIAYFDNQILKSKKHLQP